MRFEERTRECILVARLTSVMMKPKRKRLVRNVMRHDVYKCVKSPVCDPKPGDLGAGRSKRGESRVEDR